MNRHYLPAAAGESVHPVDLLPDLVAGQLEPQDAAPIRAHLDACAACATELAAWRSTAAALRDRASLAVPSTDLPDRIAARIASDSGNRTGMSRRLRWLVQFVFGQIPVVRRDIWPASAVVIAIGAGISLLPTRGASPGGALALFAPLAAAIGIAMIYGQENDPSLELALATPVSPRLVVVARLVLVFAFDLALALAASLVLAAMQGPSVVVPLIGLWLGPMLLLGCLSLALSLVIGTPGAIVVAGVLWALRALEVADNAVMRDLGRATQVLDLVWQTSPLTLALAAIVLLLAVALAPRNEGLPASPAA